jgi:hypothetical protein
MLLELINQPGQERAQRFSGQETKAVNRSNPGSTARYRGAKGGTRAGHHPSGPMFQVQQVNVGSPRPFAGYTNSDFDRNPQNEWRPGRANT